MGRTSLFNTKIGTDFNSSKWFAIDPCALLCVSLSYSFHIYALITIHNHLISYQSFAQTLYYAFYVPVAILALVNLAMAQHTNPGAVPLGARPLSVLCSPATSPTSSNHNMNMSSHNMSMHNNNQSDECDREGLGGIARSSDDGRSLLAASSFGSSASKKNNRRRGIRRCRKCNNNYKPPRSHHDSVTGRCIVKFDHFCPWVGNAVGALNHKFFFLFILYTFITSIMSILLLLFRFFRCGFKVYADDVDMDMGTGTGMGTDTSADASASASGDANGDALVMDDDINENNSTRYRLLSQSLSSSLRWLDATSTNDNNDDGQIVGSYNDNDDDMNFTFKCEGLYSIQILILCVMSVSFLFFTCCMLFEQWDAIETNVSKIARMKMKMGHEDAHEYARVSQDFNEFFGGTTPDASLHWFLPLPIRFPAGRRDRVMGFEYKDAWNGMIYEEGMDDDDDDDDDDLGGGLGAVEEERDLELGEFVGGGGGSGSSANNTNAHTTHNDKKLSPLVLKDDEGLDEIDLELPSGDDVTIKHRNALKKRSTSASSSKSLKIV